jgi:hypothetical protein
VGRIAAITLGIVTARRRRERSDSPRPSGSVACVCAATSVWAMVLAGSEAAPGRRTSVEVYEMVWDHEP